MDIKQLHDAAIDAGVDFKDDYGHHDCIDVWTRLVLSDADYMADLFMDFMCALAEEENRLQFDSLIKGTAKAIANRDCLSVNDHPQIITAYAQSMCINLENVGDIVIDVLLAEAEKYVKKYAEEWFSDVTGYHHDMMESQKEDYLYEQSKERKDNAIH